MLQFFERDDPRWPVSAAPPDHNKLSQLLSLAWESACSGMRTDVPAFPLLSSPSSSLLTATIGYVGTGNGESRMRSSNDAAAAALERLDSYGGDLCIIGSPTPDPDSFQLTSLPAPMMMMNPNYPINVGDRVPPMVTNTPFDASSIQAMAGSKKLRKRTDTPARQSKRQKAASVDNNMQCQPLDEYNGSMKSPAKKSQKLGDKITALQQLVSPFGKTDTASVLQEAAIYIKILHEQIQVLATPYFVMKSLSGHEGRTGGGGIGLRGRGLCLVPVSSTITNLVNQEVFDHLPERLIRATNGAHRH